MPRISRLAIRSLFSRTTTEQRKNISALVDEVPRGTRASAAKGRDELGRQELVAHAVKDLDRRQVLKYGTMGLAGVLAGAAASKYLQGAIAGPGDAILGTTISPTDLDAKRIAGVRIATEFDAAKHQGTHADPWLGIAIQAAINDVLAGSLGGLVFMPSGEYAVSRALRLYGGITLRGAGMGNWAALSPSGGTQANTTLRLADNANDSVIVIDTYPPNQYWANLVDFNINGNLAGQTVAQPAVYYKYGPGDLVLHRLFIRYAKGQGLLLREGFNITMDSVWIETGASHGVEVRTGNLHISKCFFMSNSGAGLFLNANGTAMEPISVTQCQLTSNAQYGIYYQGYVGINAKVYGTIAHNKIADNAIAGVYVSDRALASVGRLRLLDNSIYGVQQNCILADMTASLILEVIGNLMQDASVVTVQRNAGFPAANLVVKRNVGYVTENAGTATIPNGLASVTVNHGLSASPAKVLVSGSDFETRSCWVTTITATQFTINIPANATADRTAFWYVEV